MKKNKIGDANNSPLLILLIAIIFLAGGIAAIVLGGSVETWVLVVGVILAACGTYLLGYGVYRAVLISKVKKLDSDPSAYVTDATFVKATLSGYSSRSSSVGVGNVNVPVTFKLMVYKKIVYTYTDQYGMTQRSKSIFSFTPNQVKFLEEKKTFKIKCDGKTSLIIEDVPKGESSLEL